MFNTQKTIFLPEWSEGIFEYTGKISYGMVYDEAVHAPCFRITAYKATRKKGQNIDWEYAECRAYDVYNAYDFVDDKAPELLELFAFDGWASSGLPVDYHANAVYFYKRFRGWFSIAGKSFQSQKHTHWNLFCSITLFDSVSTSEPLPTMDSEKELYALSHWLKNRESKLRAKFNEVMRKHEIGYM